MLAIILTILFFGITITIHEVGHFAVAKLSGIRVNEFSIGMGPCLFHWGKGETRYSLRALPVGGYLAMEGENEGSDDPRSFGHKPVYKRIAVLLAGAFLNLVTGILLMGIVVGAQGKVSTTTVASLATDAPANTQIQAGDVITSVNGTHLLCANDLQFELSRVAPDQPINLTVQRGEDIVELSDVGYSRQTDEGTVRVIGITLMTQPVSIGNFFQQTFANSLFYIKMVWCSLCDLITGQVSWTQLSGPVGITQAVDQAKQFGMLSVLSLFAFLSINVGIFNLLPFPALDGGQVVFLLIELIFRRPVKQTIQQAINFAGLVAVFGLFIVITCKDIISLF